MNEHFETLWLAEPSPGVTVVTLNRPERLNALDTRMMEEIGRCFSGYYVEPEHTRAIVLTGAGERAFSAGADLKERDGLSDEAWRRQHAILEQAIRALDQCPVPVIAAVNGAAFAGGCELALACDFIYAAEHARFAQTEVAIGIIPGAMGTQNLPRAVGIRRAKEIILSGQPFTAEEARAWGMVNRVLAGPDLMPAALEIATRIAANAPIAVRQAKAAVGRSADLDRASGYMYEIEAYNRTVGTEDRREGIAAFNQKRRPVFTGR
jgi:enoyl-CoA hydratase/carnithine racemase